MSIEKIKEYNKEVNDFKNDNVQWSKLMLLCSMADYLIQEHEQKENITMTREEFEVLSESQQLKVLFDGIKITEQKEPFVPRDSTSVNDAVLGNSVEVGQIRRWTKESPTYDFINIGMIFEVNSICEYERATVTYKNNRATCHGADWIKANSELVTMENIKENEWVEFLTDYSHEYKCGEPHQLIRKGFKYKVHDVTSGLVRIKVNGYVNFVSDGATKPCLPMEEETKEPDKVIKRTFKIEPFEGLNESDEQEEVEIPKIVKINFDNIDFSDFRYKVYGEEVNAKVRKRTEYVKEVISRFNLVDIPVPDRWTDELASLEDINECCMEESEAKVLGGNGYPKHILDKCIKLYTQDDLDKAVKEAEEQKKVAVETIQIQANAMSRLGNMIRNLKKENSQAYSEGFKAGKNTVSDINKMSLSQIQAT